MSILFWAVSGLLFGVAVIGFHAAHDDKSVNLVAVSLIFIASGIFAIAGVLA